MTNKEWLAEYIKNANEEDTWEVLDLLLHGFGRMFTDTPMAIIRWLKESYMQDNGIRFCPNCGSILLGYPQNCCYKCGEIWNK